MTNLPFIISTIKYPIIIVVDNLEAMISYMFASIMVVL